MVKVVHVATRETKRQLHGNTEEGLTPDFCLFFPPHSLRRRGPKEVRKYVSSTVSVQQQPSPHL